MTFTFDTMADRAEIGNMKNTMADTSDSSLLVLAGAEMDFPTAPIIRDRLSEFSKRGIYGFTLADESYRNTICWWMQHMRAWKILPEMIVPTLGTVFALCTAIRAFTEPGDGVIIQHPSYYRFDRAIEQTGRVVVSNSLIEQDGQYRLDLEDLAEKMADSRNKLLVLCNPHNPTGKVFAREDLSEIALLAHKYQIVVFSDEIFAETARPDFPVMPYAQIDPVWGITSTSLGKTFNFTGVNHANLILPNSTLREQYLIQRGRDHFGSIDPFFYNALKAAYTPEGADWVSAMNAHTWGNYRILRDGLHDVAPQLSLSPMEGTYVVWLDCRSLHMSDDALESFFREQLHTIIDLGYEYGPGGSGFVRFCIATPRAQILELLRRLKSAKFD